LSTSTTTKLKFWRGRYRCFAVKARQRGGPPSPYLSELFGLGFVGRPVGSVMFFASGLVADPCEPDSGFLSRERSVSPCWEPPVVGVWKAFRSASSRDGAGWF
jgi:hypothetical protein